MSLSRVGVRELLQNLSRYLDGVRRGRHFEVTDRGEPVALLVPLAHPATPLEKLVPEVGRPHLERICSSSARLVDVSRRS